MKNTTLNPFIIIILSFISILSSCSGDSEPDGLRLTANAFCIPSRLVAHRGVWKAAGSAQNSLTSIRLACDNPKYLGAEIDIRESSDGVLVLCHDPEFNGMTINATPFEQLRNSFLENGEPMPTFQEALDIIAQYPGKILMLDIKIETENIQHLIDAVKDFDFIGRLYFKSFSYRACRLLTEAGIHPVFLLSNDINSVDIDLCKRYSLDGVSVYCKPEVTIMHIIQKYHQYGMQFFVWDTNRQADVEKFLEYEVDLIITDLELTNKR